MDFDHFLEQDISVFLDGKIEKIQKGVKDREEDYGLYLMKDYLKELKTCLENDEINKAKRLFDELKDMYNRLPKNSLEREKVYSVLEKMFIEIKKYTNIQVGAFEFINSDKFMAVDNFNVREFQFKPGVRYIEKSEDDLSKKNALDIAELEKERKTSMKLMESITAERKDLDNLKQTQKEHEDKLKKLESISKEDLMKKSVFAERPRTNVKNSAEKTSENKESLQAPQSGSKNSENQIQKSLQSSNEKKFGTQTNSGFEGFGGSSSSINNKQNQKVQIVQDSKNSIKNTTSENISLQAYNKNTEQIQDVSITTDTKNVTEKITQNSSNTKKYSKTYQDVRSELLPRMDMSKEISRFSQKDMNTDTDKSIEEHKKVLSRKKEVMLELAQKKKNEEALKKQMQKEENAIELENIKIKKEKHIMNIKMQHLDRQINSLTKSFSELTNNLDNARRDYDNIAKYIDGRNAISKVQAKNINIANNRLINDIAESIKKNNEIADITKGIRTHMDALLEEYGADNDDLNSKLENIEKKLLKLEEDNAMMSEEFQSLDASLPISSPPVTQSQHVSQSDINDMYEDGLYHMYNNKLKDAQKIFEHIVALRPKNKAARIRLEECFEVLNEY